MSKIKSTKTEEVKNDFEKDFAFYEGHTYFFTGETGTMISNGLPCKEYVGKWVENGEVVGAIILVDSENNTVEN